jgi:hypothetical protein
VNTMCFVWLFSRTLCIVCEPCLFNCFARLQGVPRERARHEGDQEVLVQAPGQGALRLLQLREEEAGHPQRVSWGGVGGHLQSRKCNFFFNSKLTVNLPRQLWLKYLICLLYSTYNETRNLCPTVNGIFFFRNFLSCISIPRCGTFCG